MADWERGRGGRGGEAAPGAQWGGSTSGHALSRLHDDPRVAQALYKRIVQRRKNGAATAEADAAAPEALARADGAGGGAPLPAGLKQKFEGSLGADLSGVRVHTGDASAQAASTVQAQAYTVGQNIHFGAGRFDPGSGGGQELLAHEVAHTVQQASGAAGGVQHKLEVSQPGDGAEREADVAAAAMVAGRPAQLSGSAPVVARQVEAAQTGDPPGTTFENVAGTLWAKSADGKDLPPSLDDIAQGGANDCFLFAAMAAMVNTHPQQIVDMIKVNGDGSYTVTFAGTSGWFSSADTQTVSASFAKGLHGNVTARKAIWPLIVEKAYIQETGGLAKVEAGGGNGGTALQKMTDNGPSRFDPRDESVAYILGKLTQAKKDRNPMIANSPRKEDASKEKQAMSDKIPGLHFWHAYTIVDVDPAGQRVKLFNPWGNGHPNDDGWLAIADFKVFFIEVDIND